MQSVINLDRALSPIWLSETISSDTRFGVLNGNLSKLDFLIYLKFVVTARCFNEGMPLDSKLKNVCSVTSFSLKVRPLSLFWTIFVICLFRRSSGYSSLGVKSIIMFKVSQGMLERVNLFLLTCTA